MANFKTRHDDLLGLFVPVFTGNVDKFSKESPLPKSLAFDRINEGRPFSSSFFLSNLPIEIVWHVVELMSKKDLHSLALVNRDCRQLARSRQFSHVIFDYSASALEMLGVLLQELLERSRNDGKTRLPSIGACIRKITVATQAEWITQRHNVALDDDFINLEEECRNQLLDQACSSYFDAYIKSIFSILSHSTILPHLECLDWRDRITFDQAAFEALTTSNVQRLSLRRISVEKVFGLTRTIAECSWKLKALYLDVIWNIKRRKENMNLSPLLTSILYLASPTLETLQWDCFNTTESAVVVADCIDSTISFPKLQNLRIGNLTRNDPAWLQLLVRSTTTSPIRRLSLDISANQETADFFENCGMLPFLKTFVWSGIEEKYFDKNMAFLNANPQIREFSLDFAMAPNLIDDKLLPMLYRSFSSLTSLSLTWKGKVDLPDTAEDNIPQKALDQIASLSNLEQLYLSAGCQIGWRYTWVVDHSAIQNMCHALPKLRKLALDRETYDPRHESEDESEDIIPHTNDPIHYYSRRLPHNWVQLLADPNWFPNCSDREDRLYSRWELDHRNRAIELANQYAIASPRLIWIFLGQLPISIQRPVDREVSAVPLSESRDSCYTLLRRMFGIENTATD